MNYIDVVDLKKYYGKTKGLEHANLSVKKGEILGFIGPNGAGKTTLIRILLGLLEKDSGTALIDTKAISLDQGMNQQIGYLPSEANFFGEYRVKQVLKFYANLIKKDITRGIELASYFELDLNKKVAELSYGNKKKLGIIVALIKEAPLLILDEPTTGLDPLFQKKFLDLLLKEKAKGTTILLSSHVLSEVQKVCDRVSLIKNGEVIYTEEMAKLSSKAYKIIKYSPAFKINLDHAKVTYDKDSVTIEYQGDMQKLLEKLALYPIKDLSIESVKLEDIFMHYYESETKS